MPHTTLKRKGPTTSKNPPPHASAKRVKISAAKTILAQTSDKALNKNGDLDVSAFIKAREFEIKAMATNMAASKSSLNRRAFQQVPKDLRRRTASHNVKRIPRRLRARAAREVRVHQSWAGETCEGWMQQRLTEYCKGEDGS